jgi:hypothetical protein
LWALSLLFIQVMNEIDPAPRERLARNVLALAAQSLADLYEGLVLPR